MHLWELYIEKWSELCSCVHYGPHGMFLLLCQQHRSHNLTADPGCLLTQEMRFSHIFPPFASHRLLTQIFESTHLSLHRLRKPAAHIYSLLQDHVMTKMLITFAALLNLGNVQSSSEPWRLTSMEVQLLTSDLSKTTVLCCKCSFCVLKYSQVVQFEYCNADNSLIDNIREFSNHLINFFGHQLLLSVIFCKDRVSQQFLWPREKQCELRVFFSIYICLQCV